MRYRFTTCLVILALACAGTAVAQLTGSDLTGRVIYQDGGMPGVTVTVTSPALQGQRITVTNAQGDYIIKALPAGEYKIRFELATFAVLEHDVKMSTSQPRTLDAVMYPEAMQEEIVVTGQFENVSTGAQGSATVEQSTLEKLPVLRTMYNAALLNAGVTQTGPNDALTISGAQSWENVYTVNGVVANDNIRQTGYPSLMIEDAILETTTITSSASAEYGRFAGGVVNVVTKTGGNQFSGSFRVNVNNESWNGETPQTTSQVDKNVYVYEATFGGYILRDALWFFAAGRDSETSTSGQIYIPDGSGTQFPRSRVETRYEGRLTAAFGPNHRVGGWYLDREAADNNYIYTNLFAAADTRTIVDQRTLPHEAWSLNYTGVLSDNFFLEAQYSEREFQFVGAGGDDPTITGGTPITDYLSFPLPIFNAPYWCGEACRPTSRANENYYAKASWFLSGGGTHDLVFGLDSYHDLMISENWQSASGYVLATWTPQDYSTEGQPLLQMPYYGGYVSWAPVLSPSQGSDLTTNSAYVNDTWRVSDKLTVNLGVRYDQNDGTEQGGLKVVDDSRFSPRLSASYDVKGDGKLIIQGGLSRYVVGMQQSVVDSASSAGGGRHPRVPDHRRCRGGGLGLVPERLRRSLQHR
jgi:outer membrane receptor protein involved in Fe transport